MTNVFYDPDEAYTPLARTTQTEENPTGQVAYFHTDLKGAPLDATDAVGNMVWYGRYRA